MTSRGVAALCLLVAWLAAGPTARAEDRPLVAVLPLAATDGLAIYSRPTAAALVRGMAAGGAELRVIAPDGAIAADVALVIDGRIVAAGDGAVRIEVRVRDPEVGAEVAAVASAAAPLGDIDRLVADVARRLGPIVERGLAARASRRASQAREPIELPVTVVEGIAPESEDTRPRVVVLRATGAAADGAVPVDRTLTAAAYATVDKLGFRPVAAASDDIHSHREAAALARKAGAVATLKVHGRVSFDWLGVLTARAKVRVVLTSADGTVLLDAVLRTGTVVGSKGDRHSALVRFAAEQAMLIAEPRLGRLLGRVLPR